VIVINNILVNDDVVEKQFVCDLAKCKGGCCEDGDAGAPLEDQELQTVLDSYEKIKPYLSAEANAEIEKKGKYVYHKEFGWVTPTLKSDNEICVYGVRDENGIIRCSFEQAYNNGDIPWKKPISCHLYPIITKKGRNGNFEKVNYEPREKMCRPACGLGQKLKVPAYEFLKEAIVIKYGETFYELLDKIGRKKWEEETKENKKT
jgi:Fe-S-cluster containining protein